MEPEASVSALVFHHPDCAYFTASDDVEVAAAGRSDAPSLESELQLNARTSPRSPLYRGSHFSSGLKLDY